MRESGRVPYHAAMSKQLRRRKGVPAQPQEPPGNDEYRQRLRRQKRLYQMLRDRSYREGE